MNREFATVCHRARMEIVEHFGESMAIGLVQLVPEFIWLDGHFTPEQLSYLGKRIADMQDELRGLGWTGEDADKALMREVYG